MQWSKVNVFIITQYVPTLPSIGALYLRSLFVRSPLYAQCTVIKVPVCLWEANVQFIKAWNPKMRQWGERDFNACHERGSATFLGLCTLSSHHKLLDAHREGQATLLGSLTPHIFGSTKREHTHQTYWVHWKGAHQTLLDTLSHHLLCNTIHRTVLTHGTCQRFTALPLIALHWWRPLQYAWGEYSLHR